MKHARFFFLALLSITIGGCASSGAVYRPPIIYKIQTDKNIPIEFEKFWDLYVKELLNNSFVIDNIEKESRIINVSFSINRPSAYVNCGRIKRTSRHFRTGERRFNYKVSDDSTYQVASQVKLTIDSPLWTMKRDTALKGRGNIHMEPDGSRTLLRVNVLYVWSADVSGISNFGDRSRESEVLTFSSSEIGSGSLPSDGFVKCVSNGELESQLLNLVTE